MVNGTQPRLESNFENRKSARVFNGTLPPLESNFENVDYNTGALFSYNLHRMVQFRDCYKPLFERGEFVSIPEWYNSEV